MTAYKAGELAAAVLAYVQTHPGVPLSDIASGVGRPVQPLSVIALRLVRRGLLRREGTPDRSRPPRKGQAVRYYPVAARDRRGGPQHVPAVDVIRRLDSGEGVTLSEYAQAEQIGYRTAHSRLIRAARRGEIRATTVVLDGVATMLYVASEAP